MRGGVSVLPAEVIEEGDVVGEEEHVWSLYCLEDAGDSGWTGLAALGLEELNDGKGLEVDEAGGAGKQM